MLNQNQKAAITQLYKDRCMTIREIAIHYSKSYEEVRKYLVSIGYHNGKK